MSTVGYVRVSSVGQKLDRQKKAIGNVDKLFEEKQSGKNINDRPILRQCMEYLREGDTLKVASIDRCARSLIDLNAIVSQLVDKNVTVHFVKEHMKFSPDRKNAMDKLLFNILGSFAEFERDLIKERQKEGIKAAKSRGVQFGRQVKLNNDQCKEIAGRAAAGENKAALAKEFGVSRGTIYKAIARAKICE